MTHAQKYAVGTRTALIQEAQEKNPEQFRNACAAQKAAGKEQNGQTDQQKGEAWRCACSREHWRGRRAFEAKAQA